MSSVSGRSTPERWTLCQRCDSVACACVEDQPVEIVRAAALEELWVVAGELAEALRYVVEPHHLDGEECLCGAARSVAASTLARFDALSAPEGSE